MRTPGVVQTSTALFGAASALALADSLSEGSPTDLGIARLVLWTAVVAALLLLLWRGGPNGSGVVARAGASLAPLFFGYLLWSAFVVGAGDAKSILFGPGIGVLLVSAALLLRSEQTGKWLAAHAQGRPIGVRGLWAPWIALLLGLSFLLPSEAEADIDVVVAGIAVLFVAVGLLPVFAAWFRVGLRSGCRCGGGCRLGR